jgi:formylglycine-generating enzyme required for sulfatase activity
MLRMIVLFLIGVLWLVSAVSAEDRQPGAGEELVVELPGGATMDFVWIEPGTFVSGPPEPPATGDTAESPQSEVTVGEGFYLGKYELTQGQWQSVMGTHPWLHRDQVQLSPKHPAVYITQADVQQLVQQLNQAEGDSLYRVPTEVEWEYACRAGATTRWSFGDDESQLGAYAWCWEDMRALGEGYAHAVGTKPANPWGLHDMLGNAYEWCQDSYASYSSGDQPDPSGPAPGSVLIFRGGGSSIVRARYYYVGARLVRMGPAPPQ